MRNRLARHSINNRRQELRPAALLVGNHRAVRHQAVHRAVKAVPHREYHPAVHLEARPAWADPHLHG